MATDTNFLYYLTKAQQGNQKAARKLVQTWFSRRALFTEQRWAGLRPAFSERQGDNGPRITWQQLALPALFLVLHGDVMHSVYVAEFYE
ncbi:MAG: hypothetical protein EXR62_08215 [Chloroflexi bacterium]|nr:hypothetical protein [Chloroflexota bacterium]